MIVRKRLPVLRQDRAVDSSVHVNTRCVLVSRLGRPAYDSCTHCTQELSSCIQFRGQASTAILLVTLSLAIVAPTPPWLRLGLGIIACGVVLLYMRYVAAESQRSIVNEYRLREQKTHVEQLVTERTAELAQANAELGARIDDLRVARTKLVRTSKLAAVGTLAAGVAHEINNPLSYVAANLELVDEGLARLMAQHGLGPNTRELAESLAHAREGCSRIQRIVGDLGVFARPEGERGTSIVSLNSIVLQTVAIARSGIRHRARVREVYGATPPIEANDSRLGQVVLNLLTNAAQAIGDGSSDCNDIHIATSTDSRGRAVLEIRDTGSGMPPDVLAKVFDPFFTTKAIGEGTGLGLSICHEIVTTIGGEISAESQPGCGSTFRVAIPPANRREQAVVARVEVTASLPTSNIRQRVLVIDDEPQILRFVHRILAGRCDVVTAENPREALAGIDRGEDYDLIICDMMMPHMTGAEFHAELERRASALAERMVFMTGGACTAGSQLFLDSIPGRCLLKPFAAAELRATVARATATSLPDDVPAVRRG